MSYYYHPILLKVVRSPSDLRAPEQVRPKTPRPSALLVSQREYADNRLASTRPEPLVALGTSTQHARRRKSGEWRVA